MKLPKLIDNDRVTLLETLKNISSEHDHLSIATGYWDLLGTAELIDSIKKFKSIRLLIGQEPLSHRLQRQVNFFGEDSENIFPDDDFIFDLEKQSDSKELKKLRETSSLISGLIEDGVLTVKVFRAPILHAKAYIFGDEINNNAVGIVGSSNFTKAGLTKNSELNSLESDYRIVTYKPRHENQENGHLSWFNSLWEHPDAVEWSGDFTNIIKKSPVGNITYSPYEAYIKTLMEVYEDEVLPPETLKGEAEDVLFNFQKRNAGILLNKLHKRKMAILADSVGLGKTITSGAVIDHYLKKEDGRANVQIIAPAALKNQWIEDLSKLLGIDYLDGAFNIVSQQDVNAIREIKEYYKKEWRKTKSIDLFIIDEAHNLRSGSGNRHDAILELLQQHPEAHILLLTATPINNSLMDIANQIQLASKGRRTSVNVSYIRPGGDDIEMLEFFDALRRIQSSIKKAEKNGEDVESILNNVKPTIHEGLRKYLVRSTRQGVESEGGIFDATGNKRAFPTSNVESLTYKYKDETINWVFEEIESEVNNVFEGIDPRYLNLLFMSEFTQQTAHPLGFMKEIKSDPSRIYKMFDINEDIFDESKRLTKLEPEKSIVPNILQIVYLLGFTPYKPETYNKKYYGKDMEEIKKLSNNPSNLMIQLSVHNILQITWLKRMESSGEALLTSVKNYKKKMDLFEKYLEKGYIVTLSEASLLESDYDGDDLDKAFEDYDNYLKEKKQLLKEGKDERELKKQGVEKRIADSKTYNIEQMKKDMKRDREILDLIIMLLNRVANPIYDKKMHELAKHLSSTIKSEKYGKKVVIFSFFADTVKYLEKNLHEVMKKYMPEFSNKAEFIYGKEKNTNEIVSRFAPRAKKHEFKEGETEIDFLFSTDILSEGQNLQDAGYLINYDLHWNPVRMIQRNGRINRLGSRFSDVLIANMRPTDELEVYLRLVNRLERKIKTIRNSIGLDQGVLADRDVNPIEFIEKYYEEGTLPVQEDDLLADNDEHIVNLRNFLKDNHDNQSYIDEIKSIPEGKWNYLPNDNNSGSTIALVKAKGKTKETENEFEELFFVNVECFGEYRATYLEYINALNKIRASLEENERFKDNINYDRLKVISRSNTEAKRQANNPDSNYTIKPSFETALAALKEYFDPRVDLKRTIEYGVTEVNIQKDLERVLRNVYSNLKKDGAIPPGDIKAFEKIFKEIQNKTSEEKVITNTKGVLYYAG